MAGGDPGATQQLLRHDGAGQILPAAIALQQGGRSLPLMTEAEIMTADKTGSAFVHQLFQKCFPMS